MERVIDCPVCFDNDSCFEDIQENFSSFMCFNCGFMSHSAITQKIRSVRFNTLHN